MLSNVTDARNWEKRCSLATLFLKHFEDIRHNRDKTVAHLFYSNHSVLDVCVLGIWKMF